MKILVFLLVLANLLFYAFSTGLIDTGGSNESNRVGLQLHPERIRIVASGEPPAPAALQAAPVEPVPAEVATTEVVAEAVAPVCLRWASLAKVEAERVGRVVGGGFADFTLAQAAVAGEGSGWWVHMPPQANRAAAEKKAQELKALGVSEYFIVQEGASRNAISLGIFSTEKGAQEHLAKLKAQGVRSARVGARPDKDGNLQVELRGPAGRKDALLAALAEALPKSPPKDCE
ncbi:SPOR domain-containing protein [Azonexus hydrophilus]|uniref:SPOR domain-containing protein n=1 Tax=Azonexus hydrophilus TaxID=418702 RepID=A0ABZ2XIX3_9RHOO